MATEAETRTAWLLEQIEADEERAASDIEHFDGFKNKADTWIAMYAKRLAVTAAAHRAIVELHRPANYSSESRIMPHCRQCWDADWYDEEPAMPVGWPCDTLRALATIYADREGYREEWGL